MAVEGLWSAVFCYPCTSYRIPFNQRESVLLVEAGENDQQYSPMQESCWRIHRRYRELLWCLVVLQLTHGSHCPALLNGNMVMSSVY
ncbi:MAG: hypothetical protein AB2693_34895, partial [Candidatus Thiodiazotropha sp.]